MKDSNHDTTHFGYQKVSTTEKTSRVAAVFNSVATRYNLMNDLMSFGIHRLWKRQVITMSAIKSHHTILDLAGGTGDFTKRLANRVKSPGQIVLSDINPAMLAQGRNCLLDHGYLNQITYVQANAECLPFANHSFDRIIMAFGLRNVTHKEQVLQDISRILKPGGQVLILEFSKPVIPILEKLYDKYSFNVIPKLGEWICNDRDSYQYLVESIRMHPDQNTLKEMMTQAGLEDCTFHNFSGGIVALHRGFKY